MPARAAVLVSDSPLALTDEGVLPPGEETAAPPTADQISLIQIMVVVVAVVVLLGFLWFGLNERHRFHQRHHHRREKRRKLFDFLELKK